MRTILKLVLCQILILDKAFYSQKQVTINQNQWCTLQETRQFCISTEFMAPCLIHSLPLLETILDQDQPVPLFPTDTLLLYDVNMINCIEQKYLENENEELIDHAYNSEKHISY